MIKNAAGGRRFIITKNLILMLAILAVIIVAIFAWYSDIRVTTAETTTISAKAADNVELAVPKASNGSFPLDNEDWTDELKFADSGFLKNLVKDITSGGKQFVVPNFEAAKNLREGRKVIVNDFWTDGLSSKEALTNDMPNDDDQYNYVSLDFYIRSKTKNINVTADSFLAAGCELGISDDLTSDDPQFLTGTDIYRRSSYGATGENAFSSDAVVGALRVSLVGAPVDNVSTSNGVTTETAFGGGYTWAEAADTKLLWLPRPDVLLQTDNNSDNWRLQTFIAPTGTNSEKTYLHSFYEGTVVTGGVKKGLTLHKFSDSAVKELAETETPSYFKISKVNTQDAKWNQKGYYPTLGQAANIANDGRESSKNITFNLKYGETSEKASGYYVYKYTLNIWIEGEDAEARRSMNTGIFKLELGFGT